MPVDLDAVKGAVNGDAPAIGREELPAATATLLSAVRGFVETYVILPSDEAADAIALWTLHTHAINAAECTPYLILLSPERRSGKTLLMEVLELLVRAPERQISMSEAVLFRKLHAGAPTLLLDEVDAIFGQTKSDRTEALRGVLNAGNRRGSYCSRCVGPNQNIVDFRVFGPKVLGGIDNGKLPDTIRDRGIEIRMQRKAVGETVRRFRRRDVEPNAAVMHETLVSWGAAAVGVLTGARPDLPDDLNDRTADAWESLFAIADLGGWGDRARRAAVVLAGQADTDETNYGTQLLRKVRDALSDRDTISTSLLLSKINADDELPFGGWRRGEGLDARGLARLLKPYSVKPTTVRFDDGVSKGYRLDPAMEQAFARYLASYPLQGAKAEQQNPHEQGDVPAVTAVTLFPGGGGK